MKQICPYCGKKFNYEEMMGICPQCSKYISAISAAKKDDEVKQKKIKHGKEPTSKSVRIAENKIKKRNKWIEWAFPKKWQKTIGGILFAMILIVPLVILAMRIGAIYSISKEWKIDEVTYEHIGMTDEVEVPDGTLIFSRAKLMYIKSENNMSYIVIPYKLESENTFSSLYNSLIYMRIGELYIQPLRSSEIEDEVRRVYADSPIEWRLAEDPSYLIFGIGVSTEEKLKDMDLLIYNRQEIKGRYKKIENAYIAPLEMEVQ